MDFFWASFFVLLHIERVCVGFTLPIIPSYIRSCPVCFNRFKRFCWWFCRLFCLLKWPVTFNWIEISSIYLNKFAMEMPRPVKKKEMKNKLSLRSYREMRSHHITGKIPTKNKRHFENGNEKRSQISLFHLEMVKYKTIISISLLPLPVRLYANLKWKSFNL